MGYARHVLGLLMIVWRFVAVFAWLGGPLYTYDLVKNGDNDTTVLVVSTLPIVFMVNGSLGFNWRRGRILVRVGMFGSISLLLINAFATVSCLFFWPGERKASVLVAGLIAGFLAALWYLLLARSYLSRPR
jgi:predicted MFS family arabinose efflux permease